MTSLYLDTSCFLKLLVAERETARVTRIIAGEDDVLVSSLAELEAKVRLHGWRKGGTLTARASRLVHLRIDELLAMHPFRRVRLSASIFDVAMAQLDAKTRQARTLDRLHLAAMQELGVRRLLTHDDQQAHAASALGTEVVRASAS